MKIRNRFDSSIKSSRSIDYASPSLTKQSFKDECDIHNILKKYDKTRLITHIAASQPFYGDFSNAPQNYQESLNVVIQGQDSFSGLPSSVRKRFNNNPYEFLAFMEDSSNRDEAIKLGLVEVQQSNENKPNENNKSDSSKDS